MNGIEPDIGVTSRLQTPPGRDSYPITFSGATAQICKQILLTIADALAYNAATKTATLINDDPRPCNYSAPYFNVAADD